ncbi:uncharacterized protein LOC120637313 [Pararge aegeria]|uniref:Jg6835 protein n=1 Tax=Pararge aegeria aegeria TaxID=348720 RepID=A0A8S4RNA2_9NEOP|nr:uncharacterized protein LOC120637313 [Pararge aegeria]CAH2238853.1 jg6835 [Pararge aegeria aegeria]
MSTTKNDCDAVSVVVGLVVFALPLTLLIPGFSVWNVVPKVRISRFHIVDLSITWSQLNASLVTLLVLFFCLYLELRKRELDEMVENVLTVSKATDAAMEIERDRQDAEVRACIQLLDASAEHYETLILLNDDLRKSNIQHPPVIEPSTSEM